MPWDPIEYPTQMKKYFCYLVNRCDFRVEAGVTDDDVMSIEQDTFSRAHFMLNLTLLPFPCLAVPTKCTALNIIFCYLVNMVACMRG